MGRSKIKGFSTDMGAAIYIDKDAVPALDKSNLTSLHAGLYQQMDKHLHNGWRFTIYPFGQYNLAAFTSGFGDGHYASYIGYDLNGQPCRLVTDFAVLSWTNI